MRVVLTKQYAENDTFIEYLENEFNKRGIDLELTLKYNKRSTLKLIKEKPDFDALIIQENVEYQFPVTTDFINSLQEENPKMIIVFVISNEHKNDKKFLQELYSNKIYNVLFEQDADCKNIVNLIQNPRHPKIAKTYMNIDEQIEIAEQVSSVMTVPQEQIDSVIEYLYCSSNTEELSKRYDEVVSRYGEAQNVYIISKLPKDIANNLRENMNFIKYQLLLEQLQNTDVFFKDTSVKEKIIREKVIIEKEPKIQEVVKIETINVVPDDYKKIFAFMSPESTGKTEIASNIAISLSKLTDKKVALIDLDFNKYGTLYNFAVDPGEDDVNYYKYKILLNKAYEYLKGEGEEISGDKLRELAIYKEKNFLLYTGKQELNIFEKIRTNTAREELDTLKEVIIYVIKKILAISDIVILDIGRSLDTSIISDIDGLMNIEKFLVANQNLEILNSLAYRFMLKNNSDYEGWNLIINEHRKISGFSDKELISYFNDKNVDYLKFDIKNMFYIPYVPELWEYKSNRTTAYLKNEAFTEAIDSIVSTCYPVKDKKTIRKIGLFKRFRKDG